MEFIFALPNILIAQAFIITPYFDMLPSNKEMILAKLREAGIPYPEKAMMAALILKLFAGFGLLFSSTVYISAYVLIIFTVIATYIFFPFWKQASPNRDASIAAFCTEIAIIGGLLALALNAQ